jgi:vacuolar iron transporter family protein
MTTFDLEHHLKTEHHRNAFSTYLREIVYGGNDGIVTTFAVVAGFAGAQQDPTSSAIPMISVLLFGLANLFADGLSMSLGSFLSLRADRDVYRGEKSKELHEITHEPEKELEETVEILTRKKFTPKDARTIAVLYAKNPTYWIEFMMKDELEMPNPERENSLLVAASTFGAFTIFGALPLLPYMLHVPTAHVFTVSTSCAFFALLLLGLLRAVVTKQGLVRGILETLLIGSVSATVAYAVGLFFRM